MDPRFLKAVRGDTEHSRSIEPYEHKIILSVSFDPQHGSGLGRTEYKTNLEKLFQKTKQ